MHFCVKKSLLPVVLTESNCGIFRKMQEGFVYNVIVFFRQVCYLLIITTCGQPGDQVCIIGNRHVLGVDEYQILTCIPSPCGKVATYSYFSFKAGRSQQRLYAVL